MVQPCSIATAACWASATSFPVAPDSRHPESVTPPLEPGLVVFCVERPWPVEIDSGAGVNTAYGHQTEWRRLRWLTTLQRVVQRSGDKGAHANAAGGRFPTHLLRELIIKRDCRSHDAQHNSYSSVPQRRCKRRNLSQIGRRHVGAGFKPACPCRSHLLVWDSIFFVPPT